MSKGLTPVPRHRTLVSYAVERLREYLVMSKMEPGDKLPSQETLQQQLGVSRTVVREAIKSLEMMGIVESRHGEGVFVSSFDPKPLANSIAFGLEHLAFKQRVEYLYEAREHFEVGMIELALERMQDEDHRKLQTILSQMESVEREDREAFRLDYLFHQALLESTRNPIISRFGDVLLELFLVLADYPTAKYSEDYYQVYLHHLHLYEVICSGDVPIVIETMKQHITRSKQFWLDI